MARAKPSTDLAEQGKPNTALASMFSDVAVGDDTDDRGNEDVGAKDIQIPRVDLLQDLSPQIKEDEESYIEGSKPGLLFNTLTGELYGEEIIIVPIFYAYVYNIWIVRKAGGGFRGSYPNEAAAKAEIPRLAEEADLREKDFDIVETALNYVFVVTGDGRVEEASVAFARTKLSASRKLNALIRQAGGSRWRRAFKLFSISKKNNKGTFFTFDVKPAGFLSEDMFKRAEAAYDMFSKSYKSGNLSTNFEHPDDDAGDQSVGGSGSEGDSEI